MVTMAYDTHAAARELQRAGFTDAQVDALVNVTRATASLPDISTLATKVDLKVEVGLLKSDMAELRAELKSEMAELRGELKSEMAELRGELKSEMAEIRAEMKADKSELKSGMAELRTEIASAKLQAITIILTGTAAITALGTILSKIIH